MILCTACAPNNSIYVKANNKNELEQVYSAYQNDCSDGVVDIQSAYSHLQNVSYDTESGVIVDSVMDRENVLLIDETSMKGYVYRNNEWYFVNVENIEDINFEAATAKFLVEGKNVSTVSFTYLTYLNYKVYRLS